MVSLADRLDAAIKSAGGQAEVSRRSGVPKSSLAGYTSGSVEPKASALQKIALACGVSSDRLLGLTDAAERVGAPEFAFVQRLDVRPSAGTGSVISDEGPTDVLAFRRDWLSSIGVDPERAHALEVRGDSMEPTIRDGDILLVDTSIDQIRDNGIYVVSHDGYVLVKRVQIARDGSVTLISDNANYEREKVPPEEVDALHVAGRVMWFGRAI